MAETRILGKYGPLTVVGGMNEGRFPNCNTLVVGDGQGVSGPAGGAPSAAAASETAIIDPGCGAEPLKQVVSELWGGRAPDVVVNTHYHFDHISGNHLFPGARWMMNPREAGAFRSRTGLADLMGISAFCDEDVIKEWAAGRGPLAQPRSAVEPYNRKEWPLSTGRVDAVYPVNQEFPLGGTTVVMIDSPGHTAGFCCPYFPREGVVYTGDYDLTSFGPWYAGADGDPDLMRQSGRRLLDLDAEYFVTGHQKGVATRAEFAEALANFLAVIDRRDEAYLRLVREGRSFDEIVAAGVLYPPRFHVDLWVFFWEQMTAAKHLRGLARAGIKVPPSTIRVKEV